MPDKIFEEMLNAIRDSLRDHANLDNAEDGEDEAEGEEDTVLGKLRDDVKPGWVMGTISRKVQHGMESFRQKQMGFDELTQPG